MTLRLLLLFGLILPVYAFATEPVWQSQPEWAGEFSARGFTGTALIYDESANRYLVLDRQRAQTGFIPASTFKICNALIGLQTGAVADEYEVFKWNGVAHSNAKWNRDTDLAGGMRNSTLWFYQAMARRIGHERMQDWVTKADYGNHDVGGGIDRFWLDGRLRISAEQQIDFLRKLADGTLPFAASVQETVRRITVMDSAPNYVLHAKTGWAGIRGAKRDLAWYVGWLERDGKRWFFALNMDVPSADIDGSMAKNGPQREAIARTLLMSVGALPAAAVR
jgi:beta-lactamase class D